MTRQNDALSDRIHNTGHVPVQQRVNIVQVRLSMVHDDIQARPVPQKSVRDPDPHVLGLPGSGSGSGSISQRSAAKYRRILKSKF
jgi:hypothetical protein